MRKRSKKRVPQDVKPWIRVRELDNDILHIPGKKTTRWVAGSRRDWDTKVLNTCSKVEVSSLLLKSFIKSVGHDNGSNKSLLDKLTYRLHAGNKMKSLSKYKNYCLLSGRGRTYNRSVFMARHNMRRLVGLGLISGFAK